MNTRTVQADAHQGGTGIPEMKNELRICRENPCGSLAEHQAAARHLHGLRKKCRDNRRATSAGKADNSVTMGTIKYIGKFRNGRYLTGISKQRYEWPVCLGLPA